MPIEKMIGAAMGNGHAENPPSMKEAMQFVGFRMLIVFLPQLLLIIPLVWKASSEWSVNQERMATLQADVAQLRVEMKTEVRVGLEERIEKLDERIDKLDSEIRNLLREGRR